MSWTQPDFHTHILHYGAQIMLQQPASQFSKQTFVYSDGFINQHLVSKPHRTINDDIHGSVFKIVPPCGYKKQKNVKNFVDKYHKKGKQNRIINQMTKEKIERL